MDIKIYQTIYSPEQYSLIDKSTIPYNNLKNENPLYREYPILVKLYDVNKSYDGYWGMFSPLFEEKTKITPSQFQKLVLENPGNDVYHFNCFKHHPNYYPNPFVQAESYHHKGMCEYINELMFALGYRNFDIYQTKFEPEHFSFCSFYIGNNFFWERWLAFCSICIELSETNSNLRYLYESTSEHNDMENVFNFSFVMERLVGLFFHLHSKEIKIKAF
jgi:hypothetical protein